MAPALPPYHVAEALVVDAARARPGAPAPPPAAAAPRRVPLLPHARDASRERVRPAGAPPPVPVEPGAGGPDAGVVVQAAGLGAVLDLSGVGVPVDVHVPILGLAQGRLAESAPVEVAPEVVVALVVVRGAPTHRVARAPSPRPPLPPRISLGRGRRSEEDPSGTPRLLHRPKGPG